MTKILKILVINPGSTSTKVALFKNEKEFFYTSIFHAEKELSGFQRISEQYMFRVKVIEDVLEKNDINLKAVDSVVGRGGLLRPIPGGTYKINLKMITDLKNGIRGEHACNLGGIIAYEIGEKLKVPAFIVDPVVVDEMEPIARITGIPELERRSIFHALNQRAVARKAANELGKNYNDINLIVAHLGGGISVGYHSKGKVIDVNNALDGEGPFTPERAGTLPAGQLVELCFSGKYSELELKKLLMGKGGMVAHLQTNNMIKTKKMIKAGNKKAKLIYEAMAYQVAKEISGLASISCRKLDGIILTGGLTFDQTFVTMIVKRISWIVKVMVYPGEKEMEALAQGALKVLKKEEKPKIY